MSLLNLKREAEEAATRRGHRLEWTSPWHGEHRSVQQAECAACGAFASVSTRPMPNEIDVGGSAVAVDCLEIQGAWAAGCNLPRYAGAHGVRLEREA